MYFLVMSQHTIHYNMNINELRQCCFDSGDSLTGFVLQPVSLISMASVVQESIHQKYECAYRETEYREMEVFLYML